MDYGSLPGAHVHKEFPSTPECCGDREGISVCGCKPAILIATDDTQIIPNTRDYKVSSMKRVVTIVL